MKKYSKRIFIICFLLGIIVISAFKMWPETKASPKSEKNIVIKFSAGDKFEGAFQEKDYDLTANRVNGYVTLPTGFSKTVDMLEDSYYQKIDDETYIFNEGDYSYSFTGWKIKNVETLTPSETVFQPGDTVSIDTLYEFDTDNDGVLELEALWGKVRYIQNPYSNMYYTDYWILDMDKTKTYEKTGAWNYKYEADNLTLNDGKDRNNPLSTLDYAYYLIYQEDYKNNFSNENSKNAYENVIMLTGNLDYIKSSNNGSGQNNYFTVYDLYDGSKFDSTKRYIFGEYVAQNNSFGCVGMYNKKGELDQKLTYNNYIYAPSITFKSYGDNQYTLQVSGFGYYDNVYNSIRFDNVYYKAEDSNDKRPKKISPVQLGSETSFLGNKNGYLEFTERSYASGFSVLRTVATQTVVLNNGKFPSWQTSWSIGQMKSQYNYDLHWYMGKNAIVTDAITLGTTASYDNSNSIVEQSFRLIVNGGTVSHIYGGSFGKLSTSSGKREIIVIGNRENDTRNNPKIGDIYGGAKAGTFYGDAYVTLIGANNVGSIYGGGCDFTSTTYGNVYVDVQNSTINGNIYGGGLNGNVRKDSSQNGGNVSLNIQNSKILGNIYGSGTGGTQVSNVSITKSAMQSDTNWQNEEFMPDDDFFNSIKNSSNGDYDTDWSWSKPASGFPFIQKNTEYICVAIYKSAYWTSNTPNDLVFQRNYTYAYLSLAIVEGNVNIIIDGSTVGTKDSTIDGNVYGGGSLATVEGDTYVTVKNNSIVYGNVYGGGDGVTKPKNVTVYYEISSNGYVPPTYTITRDSNGNIVSVSGQSESISYKNNVYSKTFTWSDDEKLKETNGINADNYTIYSKNVNDVGIVKGNTNVNISNSTVENSVLAGGNASDVYKATNLIINNSTINDVYGGGYSGDVELNATVTIDSGTFKNVFGGGNLGTVKGSTIVNVASENDVNLKITNLLYGGGRGYDADNDGDASDFTTVYGTSTVKIQGINTYVENYGSITLGSVQGKIDVTFKDYWTGNNTAKYKTMNGIDRATNVYFENSYVLLTNKDDKGNLLGIKSVENIFIPNGSGLKISAPGEISGNFEGGGELYLDSEVCLVIGGNITGKTTLVLNPLMYENESYTIKGGENNPYLKVYGQIPEDMSTNEATALVSGDSQYSIIYKQKDNFTQYYINNDITIDKNLVENIIFQEGRQYNTTTDSWNSGNVQILQDGIVSGDFKLKYQFKKDSSLGKKYQNIHRSIIMSSGEDVVYIPANTKITMVVGNKYYNFTTKEKMNEVELSNFINMTDNSSYNEINNVTDVASGNTVTLMYSYNEQYRFIFDFSDCSEFLNSNKTYNILLKVQDIIEEIKQPEYSSTNIVNVQAKRNVIYNGSIDRIAYLQRGKIKLNGNIFVSAVADNTSYDPDLNYELALKIKLQDEQKNEINIPDGTIVNVNNEKKNISLNNIINIVDTITKNELNEEFNVELDMSGVAYDSKLLDAGKYNLVIEGYTSENGTLRNKLSHQEYQFEIITKDDFALDAKIVDETANEDKILLFNNDKKKLNIIVNKGTIAEPYIKIKLQKRLSAFTYSDIENNITVDQINSAELIELNKIKIDNTLDKGMYRFVITLYDKNGNSYTEKTVNFYVE